LRIQGDPRDPRDGAPTGEYEDFATGFVVNDTTVWARPIGVAVAKDGALLVSEDANGTTWRISNVESVQK
jgi:glucose/arabinose dehydrogenase